jgi:response regulator RpfG family c-di-GMP phosphodiesterase
MQKVLIVQDLKPLFTQDRSLLDRANIAVFTATTNDDVLRTHIEEVVNLIITKPDLPGTNCEVVFKIISQAQHLKNVFVIMVCEDNILHKEQSKRCNAHAILTMPVETTLLHAKVQQFLNVAPRRAYRVVLNVAVDGKFKNRPFLCRLENISSSGVLIRAKLDLVQGDRISCSFYLPDGTQVNTHGEVVRAAKQAGESREKLYGVRYTAIARDIEKRIEAYIQKEQEHKPSSATGQSDD